MTQLGAMDTGIQGTGRTAGNIGSQFIGLGNSVLSFGRIAARVAATGVAALTAGIVGLGAASVKAAIDFESSFAGVLKTVNGLEDEFGNLNIAGQEIRQGFRDLAKEKPVDINELARIGEIAGQLGVQKEGLIDFTGVVADLGVTTNLSTEEAAFGLARVSSIFGITAEESGENAERMGASVVALGNNFATTERDIVAFAERVAGAGQAVGLTQADLLAIGTAISATGTQVERGGTAVQKVLLTMQEAVSGTSKEFVDNSEKIADTRWRMTDLASQLDIAKLKQSEFTDSTKESTKAANQVRIDKLTRQYVEQEQELAKLVAGHGQLEEGTDKIETFARVSGVHVDTFRKLFKEDAGKAFQLFVEGLGRSGDEATGILDELGLADQRLIAAFLSLAGAKDVLGNALDVSNEAWDENSALTEEAAKRYRTTEAQLQLLKNQLKDVGITIGDALLPFINDLIQQAKPLIEEFGKKLPEIIDNIIAKIRELVSAFQIGGITGLAAALGLSPETVTTIENVMAAIGNAIQFVIEHWEAFKGALIAVGAILAGAGIAALGLA